MPIPFAKALIRRLLLVSVNYSAVRIFRYDNLSSEGAIGAKPRERSPAIIRIMEEKQERNPLMPEIEPPIYRNVKAHPTARISPSAGIVGDVTIGSETCVLAGAQIRADDASVIIGDRVSIQENAVVHVDYSHPVTIGDHCTVGHGAIVHGCAIGTNTLVGMGSIVMNGAKVGNDCIIAAGALVSEGKEFPDRTLIMGVPARAARTLSDEEIERLCTFPADDYVRVSGNMVREGVLAHPEDGMDMHVGASQVR